MRVHPAHDVFGKPGRPGLVCVNGMGATRRSWWPLVRHFVGTHRILLYDHRGTGETGGEDPQLPSLSDYRDDLAGLVEHAGFVGATFLGFSFGGRVCIDLALEAAHLLGGLVLVSTSAAAMADSGLPQPILDAAWNQFDVSPSTWTTEVMPTLFGPEYLARHRRVFERFAIDETLGVEHPAAMARQWLAVAKLDVHARLRDIACPCLVLQGEADRLCPPHEGRRLAAGIPGARLKIYPELGHVPHIEAPARVVEDIAAFLQTLAPSPAP